MLKIIFCGTDSFAVPILRSLVQEDTMSINVVSVYTKMPSVSGRCMKVQKSPVHILADALHIDVKTPKTLRTDDVLDELRGLDADIMIVASYGLILPQSVLDITRHGCINVHPSTLPRWRGAAPIQRALMAGDSEVDVCLMQMDAGLDTGDLIIKRTIEVTNDMNYGRLSHMCADVASSMLLQFLYGIQAGVVYQPTVQACEGVTYASKIGKEEERISWDSQAYHIFNKIRALSPSPGAYFVHKGVRIKVLEAMVEDVTSDSVKAKGASGEWYGQPVSVASSVSPGYVVLSSGARGRIMLIHCNDRAWIRPLIIQKAGGRSMEISDFLRGYAIESGEIVE